MMKPGMMEGSMMMLSVVMPSAMMLWVGSVVHALVLMQVILLSVAVAERINYSGTPISLPAAAPDACDKHHQAVTEN
jgi:hypothetical protein